METTIDASKFHLARRLYNLTSIAKMWFCIIMSTSTIDIITKVRKQILVNVELNCHN